jgi:hypothetical protein
MRRDFFHSVRWTYGRVTPRLMAGALALGLSAPACSTDLQRASESSSYVMIDALAAASGASPTEFGNFLDSDVQTEGGVLGDIGRANFRLAMKDPGSNDNPLTPAPTNYITLTRYHIDYVRADGRKDQGKDTPYSFDGAMTVTVVPSGSVSTFEIVRVQSKLEAPLMNLRGLGGDVAIYTLARITFYGHDQSGRDVSVTGEIGVNFADFADESSN